MDVTRSSKRDGAAPAPQVDESPASASVAPDSSPAPTPALKSVWLLCRTCEGDPVNENGSICADCEGECGYYV